MRGPGQAVRILAVLVGVLAFLAGCADQEERPTSRIITPEPGESATTEPAEPTETPASSPSPSPTAEDEPTEEPTETPEPDEEDDGNETAAGDLDAALAAAGSALDVPVDDACSDDEDCVRPMPDGSSDPAGDVVRLLYASASGGGAVVVMARDSSDAWGLWMLTQSPYQLLDLPGQVLACARPVVVRESPSPDAPALGEVSREESLAAGGIVLTEPGSLSVQGTAWYSVSSPIQGWVAATEVTNAASGDCSHRDAAEGEPNPRG